MAIKKLKPAPLLPNPEGLEHLPLPVLLFQKDSLDLWANPAFVSAFGPVHSSRFNHAPKLTLIQERPVTHSLFTQIGRHEGFQIDGADGLRIPVELKVSPFGDPEGGIFLITFDDIRAKMELEQQLIRNHLALKSAFDEVHKAQSALIQSAKLASLGELSSGIAHELNQPLQAILGFSQELAEFEKLSPAGTEFVQDIIHASKKMAEIIKSLRSFAREAGDQKSEVSLEHAVREAAKLVSHSLLQKGIQIEIKVQHSLPMIHANAIQIEQVFVNLLGNARDAIESSRTSGGRITVTLFEAEGRVIARIRDNGCGMNEEVKQKIFDPFFTTKEVGKGTGLGLSISYGILKKHEAEVDVESQPGAGTEFKLSFRPLGINQKGEAV